jgi:hypothetical protein
LPHSRQLWFEVQKSLMREAMIRELGLVEAATA